MDMNSILADFVDKIVEVAKPEISMISGRSYSTKPLYRVEEVVDMPKLVELSSLDGVVKIIKQDCAELPSPLFVQVEAADYVKVFSDFAPPELSDIQFKRFPVCSARFADTSIDSDRTMDYETAMIALRSRFIPNEGTAYLLGLLSSITTEHSAKSEDNGMTQSVTVKAGVALKERVEVRPRVKLQPFRTFFEVEQPESEFLIRILPEEQIRILQADGGMWKMTAKRNIKEYFENELSDLIHNGRVIVMM